MSEYKNIAILGGSFDPIHKGHIHIATISKSIMELDKVIMLPCKKSPHKNNETIANDYQRIEMISLANAEHSWIETSDWELNRDSPSFSILAANHFKTIYPKSNLYWIIGNDQWKKIESWHKIHELSSILEFIVFTRDQEKPLVNPEVKSHFIDFNFNASSTEIRQDLKNRKQSISAIHNDVYKYIIEENLYL